MNAIEFETMPVNGKIEIPAAYRMTFSTPVKVILWQDEPANKIIDALKTAELTRPAAEISREEKLAALNWLTGLTAKNPVSIADARAERLARQ